MSRDTGTIRITVMVRDQPGELIKILQPLSDYGANIHGVFHDHTFAGESSASTVPVEILFTIDPSLAGEERKQRIEEIKQRLTEEKIEIRSLSLETVVQKQHVIMIGHIFDTDIRDSIMQIANTGAQVVGLNASITSHDEKSTVMFTITYEDDAVKNLLLQKIESICTQKHLNYITS